jgi:primosomal protein N'
MTRTFTYKGQALGAALSAKHVAAQQARKVAAKKEAERREAEVKKISVKDEARKEAKKTALAMGRKEAAAKREAKKQAVEAAKNKAEKFGFTQEILERRKPRRRWRRGKSGRSLSLRRFIPMCFATFTASC